MMPLSQIEAAASAIGNQVAAGISLGEAVGRMELLQPKYAEFWRKAAAGIKEGRSLSEFLPDIWPDAIVSAIKAGEASGKLEEVFARIESSAEMQSQIMGKVWELAYPGSMCIAAVVVFLFYMIKVIPGLANSLGVGKNGIVFDTAVSIQKMAEENWMVASAALGIILIGLITWLKDPDNRASILDAVLSLPLIGDALSVLYFGVWAEYMGLMDSSGAIPLPEGLRITSSVLPRVLRPGVLKMADEVVSRGISASSDPTQQVPGDPRSDWPFYVSNAFRVAEQTGNIAKEMWRAGPIMIKDGTKKFKRVLWVINTIAVIISALLIAVPMMAYYFQMGISLQGAMAQ